MSGGKRKVNKSLKAWVAFVKKVQKQEKLSYKDAIHRAKQRKDKGEKWMTGGGDGAEDEDDAYTPINDVEISSEVKGGSSRSRGAARGRGMARSRGMAMGRSMGMAGGDEDAEIEMDVEEEKMEGGIVLGGRRRTRRRRRGTRRRSRRHR